MEICSKVDAVLAKAPLTIVPIKTPEFLIPQARAHLVNEMENENINNKENRIGDERNLENIAKVLGGHYKHNLLSAMDNSSIPLPGKELQAKVLPLPLKPQILETPKKISSADDSVLDTSNGAHNLSARDTASNSILGRLSPLPTSHQNVDMLFASPIFSYTPFDTNSLLDEPSDSTDDLLLTAEFRGGLTNINYDFDLSDHSNDTSVAEEAKINLAEFDPLLKPSTPTNIPTQPSTSSQLKNNSVPIIDDNAKSLLDSDSPSKEPLLPSPLKPMVTDYRGFSTFEIPSISCNTGDFSSLNHSVNNEGTEDNEKIKGEDK